MGDEVERLGLEESPAVESTMKEELSMEIDPPFKQNAATAEDWRKALDKVVPAVVVLRTTACRAFDTEAAGTSYATGFVLDKRRGIILTNRHVVKPGPVVAEAMFLNREEIHVYPVYRDPAVRTLRFLQNGRDLSPEQWPAITIPRGTLQATFVHKGYDETYRLGLQRDTELIVRNASPPEETGMLIVDSVVPGGPTHKHLETGDVLVRINGEVLTQFLKLETLLDDSVNQSIEFQIERGGTPITVELKHCLEK